MVRINKLNSNPKVSILAKLEYFNPGGSVKDRMGKYMIEEAEKNNKLKAGGTVVENTSGNTGAAMAMVAGVKGYRAIFTIPDKMSQEKINLIKAFGAEVKVTPTDVPADSPESYYEVAKRISKGIPNSYYFDQYNNPANIEAHYKTTGPEIWEDTEGKIDYLVAGAGTGGTISGAARFLKEKNPNIKIIAVDPVGSVFYDYFKTGKMIKPNVYKLEGIGEDMLVKALDFKVIDDIIQVTDKEAFLMTREIAKQEGIFAGGSSGAALWVANKIVKDLDEPKNIVVIFPDSGSRYLSKIYNDDWMRQHNFI